MQALGAAEKVFEWIGRKPKISTEDGQATPTILKGHISFQNVTFSYPMRPKQTVLEVRLFFLERSCFTPEKRAWMHTHKTTTVNERRQNVKAYISLGYVSKNGCE